MNKYSANPEHRTLDLGWLRLFELFYIYFDKTFENINN